VGIASVGAGFESFAEAWGLDRNLGCASERKTQRREVRKGSQRECADLRKRASQRSNLVAPKARVEDGTPG
jgi:hypothetical protein